MFVGIAMLVLAAVFAALYLLARHRDRRMLRNGVFLTAAVLLAMLGVLTVLAALLPGVGVVVSGLLLLVPLVILVLGIALIGNGVTMLRLEGRSLGNLLSLVLGVLVLVLPALAATLILVNTSERAGFLTALGSAVAVVIVFVSTYFAFAFVAFGFYSIVYGRMRHRKAPDAIVVLGSGLVRGEVPPLLRSRLDRAMTVYRSEKDAGRSPVLIPSGGQGDDEPRSEGAAMAEYLVSVGADPADVLPETESRNTAENLRLSLAVQAAAGRAGSVTVVTNNYHVLRAATLARKVGADAQVIGSPTARYYVPSAFIREFAAVVVEHRWFNLLACLPFVVLAGFLLWETYQYR
ncbi:YdcF family protein [Curtobacterium sp. Leaf261]|uniref:YdcF family protein n=1 Tax=Curtobacterium sp. Leaf261 TaxID=1736311 RepID=UPI0006FBC523|nr:YdcF family protein [Curtobacterium sp. Leaf261]KQO63446.1 hypothetical protein ASF23_04100 [Curtobacterium sp. Leaf261]